MSDDDVLKTHIEYIKNSLTKLANDMDDLKKKMESDFITRKEFQPVRLIVYGGVASCLLALLGGVLGLVIIK